MKKIKSLQNTTAKHLAKLRADKTYRQRTQSVFVSGSSIIKDSLKFLTPRHLLVQEGFDFDTQGHPFFEASSDVMKKITALPSFEGVVAEFEMPKPQKLSNKKKVIALDAVVDPGNVGTIFRTALALGWEGIFLLPGCVDLFNDKTVRASSGAVLRLAFDQGDFGQLKQLCLDNGLRVWIADIHGQDVRSIQRGKKELLLLSNETRGPSENALQLGSQLTIPLEADVESLNVAVAAAILMYAL